MKIVFMLLVLVINISLAKDLTLNKNSGIKEIKKFYDHYYLLIKKNTYFKEVKKEFQKTDKLYHIYLKDYDPKNKKAISIIKYYAESQKRLYKDILNAGKEKLTLLAYRKQKKFEYEKEASKVLNDFYTLEGKGLKKEEALEKAHILTRILIEKIKDKTSNPQNIKNLESYNEIADTMYKDKNLERLLLLRKGLKKHLASLYKTKVP